jgi:hypothetical protein
MDVKGGGLYSPLPPYKSIKILFDKMFRVTYKVSTVFQALAKRMRAAINLRINDLYRRIQGEVDYKTLLPWYGNFVINLALFAKNEVKIVTMV